MNISAEQDVHSSGHDDGEPRKLWMPTALEFVNAVRTQMQLPTLAEFPDRSDDERQDAAASPAARALNCSVIKWRDKDKPCVARTKDVKLRDALIAVGGRQNAYTFPQSPGADLTYEVTIPTPDIWECA